jgi:amino acid adenylation domain-containing protein
MTESTVAAGHAIPAKWRGETAPFPEAPIHELFEEQVRARPNATALVTGSDMMTYHQLDEKANQLAHHLVRSGVRRGDLVGVCLERSADLVVALLAVLKSGGGYVPLDPRHPVQRLHQLLSSDSVRFTVTRAEHAQALAGVPSVLLCIDAEARVIVELPASSPRVPVSPDDVACALFTSGSTGRPKGVVSPHRATVRTFFGQSYCRYDPTVVLLQSAPISWDGFSLELWPALLHGGTCVLAPPDPVDLPTLAALVAKHGVTTLSYSAGLFNLAVDSYPEMFASLRQAITGGDVASPSHLRALRRRYPNLRLMNGYGPVESMVYVTWQEVEDEDLDRQTIPIGKPLRNTRVAVLDPELNLVPVGAVGELFVGGDGVAFGYLDMPGVTAECFVPDPFGPPGARLYRTGDLVRWTSTGRLEFAGRRDDQVKIRGFRVEPGESAAAIEAHPSVRQAVVVASDALGPSRRLVGYVVAAAWAQVTGAELLTWAEQRLPDFAVPTDIVMMDTLPIGPSGKLDRASLPAPPDRATLARARGSANGRSATGYAAPRTGVEAALARIWVEVLGLAQVGIYDDFFRLGGDSILIMRVTARARQQGMTLHPRAFFTGRTIAELAATVVTDPEPAVEVIESTSSPVGLTPIQRWFFENDWRNPHHFNQSVSVIVEEPVDEADLRAALSGLIDHHDALRLRFWTEPDGTWRQQPVASADIVVAPLRVVDISGMQAEQADREVRCRTGAAQRGLRLDQPPLLRAVLFKRGPASAELLLVAHHLAVDTVSWGILVEDLLSLYDARREGGPPALIRTSSYAEWARRLASHLDGADAPTTRRQRDDRRPPPPPSAEGRGGESGGTTGTVTFQIAAEQTTRLLTCGQGTMQELLLAGLSHALTVSDGPADRIIELEQHGRDHSYDDIDLLRTVGWFTRVVDFVLPAAEGVDTHLNAVRQRLSTPEAGLDRAERCSLSFNYLGRIGAGNACRWAWRPRIGSNTDPRERPTHSLAVVARVMDNELMVDLIFEVGVHRAASVNQLAATYSVALQRFARTGTGQVSPGALVRTSELTPIQVGMLFPTLSAAGSGAYVEQRIWRVGPQRLDAHVRAWQLLFQRHDALRMGIRWRRRAEPRQFFANDAALPVTTVDLSAYDEPAAEQAFADFLREDRRRGFDLEAPPLARLSEVRLGGDDIRLVLTNHHLLLDGWSYGILLDELATVIGGDAPSLPPAPSFERYTAWLRGQATDQALGYWRSELAGVVPSRMFDSPARSGDAEYREYLHVLDRDASERVRESAIAHGLTLSTLLHGCWALALSVYLGRVDVVFATTFAVRPDTVPDVERIVGPMINTSPVRVRVDGGVPAVTWLQTLQLQILDIRGFTPLPLGAMAGAAGLCDGAVLCDTAMAFENYPMTATRSNGVLDGVNHTVGAVMPAVSQPDFPLTVIVKPNDQLGLKFIFDSAVVTDERVRGLAEVLAHLVVQVADDPERVIGAIPLVPPLSAEAHMVPTPLPVSRGGADSVVDLFHEQVARRPEATAVSLPRGRVTYGELDRRANRLASHLRMRGARAGTVVGVCLERGLDLVTTVLAVLKSGAIFLPLDRENPPERLVLMAGEAHATMVVTPSRAGIDWPPDATIVALDHLVSDHHSEAIRPSYRAEPDDPAYIIHTSGSTGAPKGVLVTHGGLVNRLDWMAAECGLTADDVVLQKTAFGFDVAVWELLWPLAFGARLHVTEPYTERDAGKLAMAITESQCTALHFVPSALDSFVRTVRTSFDSPRLLACSGEALSGGLAEAATRAFPNAQLYNLYGPTEATIDATYFRLVGEPADAVPIGRPISNLQAVVVDRYGRQVPDGVKGELVLGGVGVALGYAGRPAQTAERFAPNPFGPPGSRLYRTGDIVRRPAAGEIEYLGRMDRQVKIRGFRVECEEVEKAVAGLDGVGAAAVVAPMGADRLRRLVAFVAPADGRTIGDLDAARLRERLAERVPDFLIPTQFVPIQSIPLKPNGKVDLAALPVPDGPAERAGVAAPPRTATETALVRIWAEVLGHPRIGVDDNFFSLGGHSLAAMRIAGMAGLEFGVEVPVNAAFDWPTVAEMAAAISRLSAADRPTPIGGQITVQVSFGQQAMWLLQQMDPGSPYYNVPLTLRLRGSIDLRCLVRAVNALVERHEVLRTRFVPADGVPQQVVEPVVGVGLTVKDVSGAEALERARELVQEELSRPFDLGQAPLLRCLLARLGHDDHVVLLTTHHIVCDAWSKAVLKHDLLVLYHAEAVGVPDDLPDLPVRYRDFVVWERDRVEGDIGRRHLKYWLEQLSGAPPAPRIPITRPAPDVPSRRGGTVRIAVDPRTVAALEALATDSSATLFTVLLAAFQVLLARWSGSDDVIVGTPVAGRHTPELYGLVGLFANTVPIRVHCGGDPTFVEFVDRVRHAAVGAYAHQELPFERMVKELAPDRTGGGTPLVQVLLQELTPAWGIPDRPEIPGVRAEPFPVDAISSQFDLTVSVHRAPDGGMSARFTYAVDRFGHDAIDAFAQAWHLMLDRASSQPRARVSELCAAAALLLRHEAGSTAPGLTDVAIAPIAQPEIVPVLRRIWCQLLELDDVKLDDDFFRLGGHSILAARMCARVHEQLGVYLPLPVVFDLPRLGDLAAAVAELRTSGGTKGPPPILPERAGGTRTTSPRERQ